MAHSKTPGVVGVLCSVGVIFDVDSYLSCVVGVVCDVDSYLSGIIGVVCDVDSYLSCIVDVVCGVDSYLSGIGTVVVTWTMKNLADPSPSRCSCCLKPARPCVLTRSSDRGAENADSSVAGDRGQSCERSELCVEITGRCLLAGLDLSGKRRGGEGGGSGGGT